MRCLGVNCFVLNGLTPNSLPNLRTYILEKAEFRLYWLGWVVSEIQCGEGSYNWQ